MSFLLNLAIHVGVGLTLFFMVGQLVDSVVYRFAVGPGDPMTNILADAPNPRRRFIINIVRPVLLSVIIFGGGLLMIAIMGFGIWGAISAGAWYFFLAQIACLAGRRASLNEARWTMIVTIIVLIAVNVMLQSAR